MCIRDRLDTARVETRSFRDVYQIGCGVVRIARRLEDEDIRTARGLDRDRLDDQRERRVADASDAPAVTVKEIVEDERRRIRDIRLRIAVTARARSMGRSE